MRTTSAAVTIASVVFALACGGDSKGVTNPNPNQAGKSMSARIDGAAWTAATVNVSISSLGITIVGSNASGRGIGIAASRSLGTGTQTFGTNPAALGTFNIGTQSWSATGQPGGGSSGSVTLTTLTANHAVGTFAFTATPFVGGGTGTHVITAGVFDVTF